MGFCSAPTQQTSPLQNRTVDGLRRKFSSRHRKKIPTGDPLMPSDVRRPKHIRYKMTERADMGIDDSADADAFFPTEDQDGTPSQSLFLQLQPMCAD